MMRESQKWEKKREYELMMALMHIVPRCWPRSKIYFLPGLDFCSKQCMAVHLLDSNRLNVARDSILCLASLFLSLTPILGIVLANWFVKCNSSYLFYFLFRWLNVALDGEILCSNVLFNFMPPPPPMLHLFCCCFSSLITTLFSYFLTSLLPYFLTS